MSIGKNPHAVFLGRLGGVRGGPARAARLSATERREIAVRAARARWGHASVPRGERKPLRTGTRERLVSAARREIRDHGPSGARVDRIARRARVNKRMVYHYFGSRAGLLAEVFRRHASHLAQNDSNLPAGFEASLRFWGDLLARNPGWMRVSLWEELDPPRGSPPPARDERRAVWSASTEEIRARQARGEVRSDVPAEQIQLALVALAMFPAALPRLTEFATGLKPSEPGFLAGQEALFRSFAAFLERKPPP